MIHLLHLVGLRIHLTHHVEQMKKSQRISAYKSLVKVACSILSPLTGEHMNDSDSIHFPGSPRWARAGSCEAAINHWQLYIQNQSHWIPIQSFPLSIRFQTLKWRRRTRRAAQWPRRSRTRKTTTGTRWTRSFLCPLPQVRYLRLRNDWKTYQIIGPNRQ